MTGRRRAARRSILVPGLVAIGAALTAYGLVALSWAMYLG